jgi:hypothetical protein
MHRHVQVTRGHHHMIITVVIGRMTVVAVVMDTLNLLVIAKIDLLVRTVSTSTTTITTVHVAIALLRLLLHDMYL